MKSFKEIREKSLAGLKTKKFKIGGYSVTATVIVIAIAVIINILVSALPANITQLDVTSNGLYSISQETKDLLAKLDDDVTLYWIVQDGQEDSSLELLLNKYESLSSKITLEKKDPDVYPTFAQQYIGDQSLSNNSLVVECGDSYRYISYDGIYQYDYSNYYTTGSYDISFAGESKISSAINYVTGGNTPKLYTLTGHGEAELSESFTAAVEDTNTIIEEISLLTVEAVPDDADCVLIYAPQSDISGSERELIKAYIDNGGSVFLITDPLEDNAHLQNIEDIFSAYGVTANDGIIIEGNQNYYIYGQPYYLLPEFESHDITQPLIDNGYYVLLPVAQGLSIGSCDDENVSVSPLLYTSDSAFSKLAGYSLETYEKEDGDIDGPFYLGAAIADDESGAQLVWVSSGALLDDDSNSVVSGGNQDFFLNALSWMSDDGEGISIHAKSISYDYLTMESGTASTLAMVFEGLIPLSILGVGIYVWIRRKRR